MCVNCGVSSCTGTCDKPAEIKYTSQIIYDGPLINYPGIDLTIEPCDDLNDIIAKFAEKLNELAP
jgi:hypothetical protein